MTAWLLRTWYRIVALLAVLCVVACVPAKYPSIPEVCADAGANLRKLECPNIDSPAGVPFETICETTERSGFSTMHPTCIAAATSCDEAERVSQYGCD